MCCLVTQLRFAYCVESRVGLRSARGDLHFADKVEYRPVSVLVLGVAKAAVIAALHGDQSIRRTQAFMQCGGLLKGTTESWSRGRL